MWSVILKILSILGILLLCLFALALLTVLLVLFCPAAYRGGGTARPGKYQAWFRFRWLFGLVRGAYMYPEDGRLRVKVLWMTVYDSGRKRKPQESPMEQKLQESQPEEKSPEKQKLQESQPEEKSQEEQKPQEAQPEEKSPEEQKLQETQPEEKSPEKQSTADGEPQSQKMSELKEKLRFYLGIVRDEDNRELVKYGLGRLGRIIKSIRPRYLRAEAVAGLGEPDLTGYAYGIYWAIKPFLGNKCRVDITPDFERRILEGEVFLRGRITAAVLLYHVCRVLLDRRLRQLLDQLNNK